MRSDGSGKKTGRTGARRWVAILAAMVAAAAGGVRLAAGADPLVLPDRSTADLPPIQQLSWMSGCWEQTLGDRVIEEQWMSPRGGAMLGMGRTVKGDTLRDFEAMRIEEQDGRLVFTAHPSGQSEASFTAIELTPTRVVFENPSHDFPRRVIYRKLPDGSMAARIEGNDPAKAGEKDGGKVRSVDFPMKRCACPAGGSALPGRGRK
jgi:hypothetical protein